MTGTKRIPLRERALPDYTRGEEIMNTVTHIVGGAVGSVFETFVVVIDSYGEGAFGVFLPDDILVEVGLDFGGGGYARRLCGSAFTLLLEEFLHHLVGFLGTGVADVSVEAGD